MKNSLISLRNNYAVLENISNESHTLTINMCIDIATWLDANHKCLPKEEAVSVEAFKACMSEHDSSMVLQIGQTTNLVNNLVQHDLEPEEHRKFQETIDMPMRVDWDRSYFVLRSIYDEAIGKMESEVSEVRVVQLQNGEYQGSIEISAHPHLFVGDSGCTKIAAKSKILYSAIKHVNQTLGCGIIDLNCSILHHEENFISQLDQKIHGVWRCGQKLERLLLTSEDALLKNINHVTDNIRANECTMYVATTIASSASELARLKSKFYEAWSVFMNNLTECHRLQGRQDGLVEAQ